MLLLFWLHFLLSTWRFHIYLPGALQNPGRIDIRTIQDCDQSSVIPGVNDE